MNEGQRLKEFMECKKISRKAMGDSLLIEDSAVSKWKVKIPEKHLISIIRVYPDLNANWLIKGDGPMLVNDLEEKSIKIQTPHNHLNQSEECTSPVCQERIKSLTEMVRELREFKRYLQETVDDLRRKEAATGKRDEGGVESGNERRAAV